MLNFPFIASARATVALWIQNTPENAGVGFEALHACARGMCEGARAGSGAEPIKDDPVGATPSQMLDNIDAYLDYLEAWVACGTKPTQQEIDDCQARAYQTYCDAWERIFA